MAKLSECVPREFGLEHMTVIPRNWSGQPDEPTPAAKLLDVEVIVEHSRIQDGNSFQRWPGKQKNVYVWWELANGKIVGWNENPASGWSFPVMKNPNG